MAAKFSKQKESIPNFEFDDTCQFESLVPLLLKARTELAELKGYTSLFQEREALLNPLYLNDASKGLSAEGVENNHEAAFENQLYSDGEQSEPYIGLLRIRDGLLMEGINALQFNDSLMSIGSVLNGGEKALGFRKRDFSLKKSLPGQLSMGVPSSEIEEALSNVQGFLSKSKSDIDPLIKACVVHFNLEHIQPFSQYNSRMAKIYFNKLLVSMGLLKYPVLTLGEFVRSTSENFVKVYKEVTHNSDWCPYLKFMLLSVASAARKQRQLLEKTLVLHRETQRRMISKCEGAYSPELLDLIFIMPVLSPLRLSARLDIHYTTSTRYLRKLMEEGILINRQSGKYQLYINRNFIQLLGV
ncbi:MAG: Fic family protein [Bacteroidetes bacterium]|nr:Fic family protein [Bacteroidota bacterium]